MARTERCFARRATWVGLVALVAACGSGSSERSSECPDDAATFEAMNAATYAIVPILQIGTSPPVLKPVTLGTAFAVGEHLLVTNAHMTEAFNPSSSDFAFSGQLVAGVVAVQAGTGKTVKLLRGLTHPDYTGDPFASPDVGLFTTSEVLPSLLPVGSDQDVASLALDDTLFLSGFPGDVDGVFPIIPGTTVPQATDLSGKITAFRNHDPTVQVTTSNRDVIQHQAPTTPGTSGSPMTHCGKVVDVNNAGTVNLVVVSDGNGGFVIERQAAAANNFGVSVHYVNGLMNLFEEGVLQGFELPPPYVAPAAPSACQATPATNGCADPSYPRDCGFVESGSEACGATACEFACPGVSKCFASEADALAACGDACHACSAAPTPAPACRAAPTTNACTDASYPRDCGFVESGGEVCGDTACEFVCPGVSYCLATEADALASCGDSCHACGR